MRYIIHIMFAFLIVLTGCGEQKEAKASQAKEQPELLFYVGITMVKPMTELSKRFERTHGVKIKILQGGSEDLYQSAKNSKAGDLYMPGSLSYRTKYLEDGVLEKDAVFVGYNRAALMVPKGNPKGVNANLKVLLDERYKTVLCNPESGSIGNETKKILTTAGIYNDAMAKAVYLTTDSRNLINAIKQGDADVILNWRATAFWDGNKEVVDVLDLPEAIAPKSVLVLTLLKSSRHPDTVRQFMAYATSQEGRAVFHAFGFLNDDELARFDTLSF